ncbi:MAG: hypothetical protein GY854_01810 [Deltaproteobacteria bacterium]|nr:hypothetical protein [Deltaproteobacteria bacterium]
MANEATPTKVSGPGLVPGIGTECKYTLLLGTTHSSGYLSVDITSDFGYIYSCEICGSLAATGYVAEVQKPAYDAALTSTNLKIFFYEAGADAAALDLLNAVDLSAVITGLTIAVTGKPAAVTSWA